MDIPHPYNTEFYRQTTKLINIEYMRSTHNYLIRLSNNTYLGGFTTDTLPTELEIKNNFPNVKDIHYYE